MRTETRGYAERMGIFGGRSAKKNAETSTGAAAPASARDAQAETTRHFREFIATRPECEAFVEPATRVTQTTMVIVAGTGEWTRRKVPDLKAGQKLARDLGVPVFDVNLSGYPSRMREWDQQQRRK